MWGKSRQIKKIGFAISVENQTELSKIISLAHIANYLKYDGNSLLRGEVWLSLFITAIYLITLLSGKNIFSYIAKLMQSTISLK